MRGIAILLLFVIFFCFCWPYISRWLKRKALQKAEDYLRSRLGVPPNASRSHNPKNPFGTQTSKQHEPLIPKEYAEDVEFVETKEFSRHEETGHKRATEKYNETQVSDAEWTEIKSTRTK